MSALRTDAIALDPREARDSRGRPTVEVTLRVGDIAVRGDVPAGASKGEDEAKTVSTAQAIDNIRGPIAAILRDAEANLHDHAALRDAERAVVVAAGDNFAVLGANAVLPVSRALWRAAAAAAGMELWAYIQQNEPAVAGRERVHFLMNIFNGGLHALKQGETLGKDRIDIQEIMVVPVTFASYQQAMAMGEAIDQALQGILHEKYGAAAVTRGDEAGFTVKGLGDSDVAIAHVFAAIEKAGYQPGRDVKLALDVAASSFYDTQSGTYQFQGKSLSTNDMVAYLVGFADKYAGKVLSIEDGLAENDWEGWTALTHAMRQRGVVTIGDDLFVTQLGRLHRGIETQAADAILIKVNQNGSVGGTLDVMHVAKQHGMQCVVSHRSGETLDDSIADLAAATGALGLKTGDPQPPAAFPDRQTWVRRAKYLRMIDIERVGG